MSGLTPFIHSTDTPASTFSISVAASGTVILQQPRAWQFFPPHPQRVSPAGGVAAGFLRSSHVANQPLMILLSTGKCACVSASGRRQALKGKEVALPFVRMLLRSLNMISSLRISFDFAWRIPGEAFRLSWVVTSPGKTPDSQALPACSSQWIWTLLHYGSYPAGFRGFNCLPLELSPVDGRFWGAVCIR